MAYSMFIFENDMQTNFSFKIVLKLIVFTVNENKNICKAGVNCRASFTTVRQLLKWRKWLKPFKISGYSYLVRYISN